jgi:hypothetical protein
MLSPTQSSAFKAMSFWQQLRSGRLSAMIRAVISPLKAWLKSAAKLARSSDIHCRSGVPPTWSLRLERRDTLHRFAFGTFVDATWLLDPIGRAR